MRGEPWIRHRLPQGCIPHPMLLHWALFLASIEE
jgi:hypothetical protein